MGADSLINYRNDPEWVTAVFEAKSEDGADLIIETVGGQNLNKSLKALRVDGHISVVGFLDGQQSALDLVTLNLKRAKIHGLSVGSRQDFADMLRAMSANTIRPIIDQIFPFQATPEAFPGIRSTFQQSFY